jgi:hypothetical protein
MNQLPYLLPWVRVLFLIRPACCGGSAAFAAQR